MKASNTRAVCGELAMVLSPSYVHVGYMQYVGQRATKLPVLFQPYLLQVMYMTFQYLTVSCIPGYRICK